jgi:RNA polymerase sigma-70 factor (ECF subfamily)
MRALVERGCVDWQTDLKLFLLGVLKDRHAVEDAYQRTVLRALAAAETARKETLRGWMFRIALNEARQLSRDQRRRQSLVREAGPAVGEPTGSFGRTAGEGLIRRELIDQIRIALQRLPPNYQDIVRRRIYQEQTFAEIAEELNLPLGTVLTWMRRALIRLQDDPAVKSLRDDTSNAS